MFPFSGTSPAPTTSSGARKEPAESTAPRPRRPWSSASTTTPFSRAKPPASLRRWQTTWSRTTANRRTRYFYPKSEKTRIIYNFCIIQCFLRLHFFHQFVWKKAKSTIWVKLKICWKVGDRIFSEELWSLAHPVKRKKIQTSFLLIIKFFSSGVKLLHLIN